MYEWQELTKEYAQRLSSITGKHLALSYDSTLTFAYQAKLGDWYDFMAQSEIDLAEALITFYFGYHYGLAVGRKETC